MVNAFCFFPISLMLGFNPIYGLFKYRLIRFEKIYNDRINTINQIAIITGIKFIYLSNQSFKIFFAISKVFILLDI
mgnify:CR=1 FL=1